jgi:phosphatidylserine decarboxylase
MIGPFVGAVLILSYFYWRYEWFFRNPPRKTPEEPGVVSPADGTVVYVKQVQPGEEVFAIKKGCPVTISDIAGEELSYAKIVIGIFMSPFDVHYNRAPLSGDVVFIRHHPARTNNRYMQPMHLRTLIGKKPFYKNSLHILHNERTVTKFTGLYRGIPLPCYMVQIAGKTVNRIESYLRPGASITRGDVFGMIKWGSQVDLIVRKTVGMQVKVQPGDRVRAGETILIA